MVVPAGEVAGDAGPVEQLVGERTTVATGEGGAEQVDRDLRLALFHAGVRLSEIEHIQQIFRRDGVDRAVVDDLALIEDVDCRQPDQVQRADMRIPMIELQRHESGGDGCDDGGVWIRHGIQQFTAYSIFFFDIDQDEPVALLCRDECLVPIVQPVDRGVAHSQPSCFDVRSLTWQLYPRLRNEPVWGQTCSARIAKELHNQSRPFGRSLNGE